MSDAAGTGPTLKRYAGSFSLWGFAVSLVIAGEFGGWNRGLIEGGFGGLLIATLAVTILYACLAASLAEMAAVMPFAGGAYAYARVAMGPSGGFLAGVAQAIEYSLSVAVLVVSVGAVLREAAVRLTGTDLADPFWWVAL
jgi:ethanolamine permease